MIRNNKKAFEDFLNESEFSKNTKLAYSFAVNDFCSKYADLSKANLTEYKCWLIDNFRPKTANLRILALNKYLDVMRRPQWRLKLIKEQQKTFVENIISFADYDYLKGALLNNGDFRNYFIVRFMGATGARVSELVKFKIEDVKNGFTDILSKGGKIRRIYFVESLKKECLNWCSLQGRNSGWLFLSREGINQHVSTRAVAQMLKYVAKKYGIDEKVMYPHSFRHMFAKRFLTKNQDLSLLADLMGHDSIETTRIYLRKTSTEQLAIVNDIVDW